MVASGLLVTMGLFYVGASEALWAQNNPDSKNRLKLELRVRVLDNKITHLTENELRFCKEFPGWLETLAADLELLDLHERSKESTLDPQPSDKLFFRPSAIFRTPRTVALLGTVRVDLTFSSPDTARDPLKLSRVEVAIASQGPGPVSTMVVFTTDSPLSARELFEKDCFVDQVLGELHHSLMTYFRFRSDVPLSRQPRPFDMSLEPLLDRLH